MKVQKVEAMLLKITCRRYQCEKVHKERLELQDV